MSTLTVESICDFDTPDKLLEAIGGSESIARSMVDFTMRSLIPAYMNGRWNEDFIGRANSVAGILVWSYRACLKVGFIKPIEELDEDVKKELWQLVIDKVAPKEERRKRILLDLTRAMHVFVELSKLKYKKEIESNEDNG